MKLKHPPGKILCYLRCWHMKWVAEKASSDLLMEVLYPSTEAGDGTVTFNYFFSLHTYTKSTDGG